MGYSKIICIHNMIPEIGVSLIGYFLARATRVEILSCATSLHYGCCSLLLFPMRLRCTNHKNADSWKEGGQSTYRIRLLSRGTRWGLHMNRISRMTREDLYIDRNRAREKILNCETQNLNPKISALIPCQVSCTSQRKQKSELWKGLGNPHIHFNKTLTYLPWLVAWNFVDLTLTHFHVYATYY